MEVEVVACLDQQQGEQQQQLQVSQLHKVEQLQLPEQVTCLDQQRGVVQLHKVEQLQLPEPVGQLEVPAQISELKLVEQVNQLPLPVNTTEEVTQYMPQSGLQIHSQHQSLEQVEKPDNIKVKLLL